MRLKALALCTFCFVAYLSSAQKLKQRGSLGIEFQEATDSLLQSLRITDSYGIIIKKIAPNSTAQRLGLEMGDVLVAINEVDSLTGFDFLRLNKRLEANEAISVTYVRNRRKNRVVGQVVGAPRESSAGEVVYSEVPYQRGLLRSIMHKPVGGGRFPTVYFLQNYDCTSIDYSQTPNHPVKQLIDGWVNAGFAVYRLEKPGVGESNGTKDCARLSFTEELKAFEGGWAALHQYAFVDTAKIFLFGHATGGTTAAILAAQAEHKPRGVIAYGAVVKPWFEHTIQTLREPSAPTSLQSIEANVRMLTPLLFDWLVQGKTANELLQNPEYETILTSKENPIKYNRGLFYGRNPEFFSEMQQQNVAQAWAQVARPTLAIYGEKDSQGGHATDGQTIAAIANEIKPGRGSFKILKNTDHFFVKVGASEDYTKVRKETTFFTDYALQNFNPEIVEMTVGWMKQQ